MNMNSLEKRIASLSTELEKKGIVVTDKTDDALTFNKYGGWFIIQIYRDDNTYFRLLYPNFYKVSEIDEHKLCDAINRTNLEVRVAKIFRDNDNLWSAIECFNIDEIDFINNLEKYVELIKASRLKFTDYIK